MANRIFLWSSQDPRGVMVSLGQDTWEHITQAHAEMREYFEAIEETISHPDEIYFDETSSRNRATGAEIYAYYKRNIFVGLLRTKTLYVSVKLITELGVVRGYVQTAFPTRSIQKRMIKVWSK